MNQMASISADTKPKPRRSIWQFKIRTLIVITFVASFIALVGRYVHISFEQERIVEGLSGGEVLYDYEYKNGTAIPRGKPEGSRWVRERLGDKFFSRVTFVSVNKWDIEDIESIYSLHTLEHLTMFNCDKLKSLEYIQYFDNLAYIDFGDCDGLTDISHLKNVKSLKHLDLFSCDNISSIECLAGLPSLEYLDISNCPNLSSFECIQTLKQLKVLKFAKSPWEDVSCVLDNSELIELHLEDAIQLASLKGLENLKQLQIVNLRGCRSLPLSEIDRISKLMPGMSLVTGS